MTFDFSDTQTPIDKNSYLKYKHTRLRLVVTMCGAHNHNIGIEMEQNGAIIRH